MLADQWGRFIYWAGQNSATVQALAAVATVLLTAALAAITYGYMRISRKQLLLLAQPNIVVETTVNAITKEFTVCIYNKGVYPFRLCNVEAQAQDILVPLRELSSAVVGAGGYAYARESLHGKEITQEELDCGAFEDFLSIEFDCEDLMQLASRRYGYSKINGLKDIGAPKGI